MTFDAFDKFFDELIEECRKMRDTKGREYTFGASDRFHNFKNLSEELSKEGWTIPPSIIGYIYAKKHINSVVSFLKYRRNFSEEKIRGRFVDLITYLLLIAGMVFEEELQTKTQTNQPPIPGPLSMHEVSKKNQEPLDIDRLLDELAMLHGLSPHDSPSNLCRNDPYFAKNMELRHGKPIKELEKIGRSHGLRI